MSPLNYCTFFSCTYKYPLSTLCAHLKYGVPTLCAGEQIVHEGLRLARPSELVLRSAGQPLGSLRGEMSPGHGPLYRHSRMQPLTSRAEAVKTVASAAHARHIQLCASRAAEAPRVAFDLHGCIRRALFTVRGRHRVHKVSSWLSDVGAHRARADDLDAADHLVTGGWFCVHVFVMEFSGGATLHRGGVAETTHTTQAAN